MMDVTRLAVDSDRGEIPVNGDGTECGVVPGLIVGTSLPIIETRIMIAEAARTDGIVLLVGESGTGKELFARLLHVLSPRCYGQFVSVNCAAIPDTLIESELFGYEKGAFTGAFVAKPGKFELANGGTLFLDEIGDLSLSAQAKILRVLETRGELEQVGGKRRVKVDIRIVAATNKNLWLEVCEKRFREDLFYRLNVVVIKLPPLRERREDIPLIVDFFCRTLPEELRLKRVPKISPEAMQSLVERGWRGNVRELRNVLERALTLYSRVEVLESKHLPDPTALWDQKYAGNSLNKPPLNLSLGLRGLVRGFEEEVIKSALGVGGNLTETAEILQLSFKTLRTRMRRYGIRRPVVVCKKAEPAPELHHNK